jgi:hypothetical protein
MNIDTISSAKRSKLPWLSVFPGRIITGGGFGKNVA